MKNIKEQALKISLLVTLLFAIASAVTLEPYGISLDEELHCDDCSSGNVIPNGYSIVYFGETYQKMFVSSNGMISLGCEGSDVTTFSTELPIIAPFMTDLDTQLINNEDLDGTVFYRTEVQSNPNFDQFALDHFGLNFFTTYSVIVTYDRVKPKHDQTVTRNTFQAAIYVSAYGDTSVCFNYPSGGLQWPDLSFTEFPIVGFYSGSELNLQYYLPGSGTVDSANLDSRAGNFGELGQYCYIVSRTEILDRCDITDLQCREPHYVYVNSQIGLSDVLSSYTICNDLNVSISANTLNCNQLNQLIPITARAGVEQCTSYLVPIANVQLGYVGCPADITAYASDSTTVSWVAPTAVGDCLVPSSEYISHNPDSTVFALGTTRVTYIAYDAQFHSATCSFEVTVLPTVRITYEVIDVLNRPIVSASVFGYPDCTPTDATGKCSILAPQYKVGDIIPAGSFYVIDINGNLFAVRHDAIQIECFNTHIVIIVSPPGFYRSATGDILPCAAGTYSTTYEASACTSCPVGTYTDEEHATRCDLCPPGYSSGEGDTTCFSCNAGFYLDEFSGRCLACPAGSYSCDRATECKLCPAGSWSNGGAAVCSYCSAGYYFEDSIDACLPCPANTFSGDRATQCTACPHGSYSSQGSTECQFCVAGFFFNENTGACEICPGGFYSCDRATECTACPPGGFASPGSAECSFCNAGYYMGMENDQPCECYLCPAGTFSCDSAEECIPCPTGTWSMAGASSCYACYAGYYLDRECGECEPCPANYFSADNAFECTPCPEGSYSAPGSIECTFCVAGYYFNSNLQVCQLCPAGTFSNERATECTPCPPGAYSFPGSDTCLFCTAGYYLDSNTATCLPCPAGFFSCDRADSCEACPTGSYSYPGSSACSFCQAGYYFEELSQSCIACPAGTFSNERATQCTPCPQGFYSFPGSFVCFSCTAGFYLDLDLGSCLPCPAGTTSGDRALECILLPTTPVNEQVFCQAGFYLDVGSNTCLPCPANSYSLEFSNQCIPCPTGSYSMIGSSQCIFCTAGYYLDTSLGYCAPCPPNTFSSDRATQCIPCAFGYISDAAASTCTACPANTVYNADTKRCEACTGDSFIIGNICISCCDWEIPHECQICPPGHQLDYVCAECCPGYYSEDGKECEPCYEGWHSGNGFDHCVYCEEGTHWDFRFESCVYDSSCTSDGM